MRTAVVAVVAVVLMHGAASGQKDKDAVKKELAKFNGTWKAVSFERDGKPASREDVAKTRLVVKGDHYTFQIENRVIEGTHKLDPTSNPKKIDAVRSKGKNAGETLKGIYTLDDDTYKVCFADAGKPRPKEFSTTAGGGHRLIVMKRAGP